eukprot:1067399-Rhodomonas_salina.2
MSTYEVRVLVAREAYLSGRVRAGQQGAPLLLLPRSSCWSRTVHGLARADRRVLLPARHRYARRCHQSCRR